MQVVQRALAAVAVAFGLATVATGTRVLLGADPGYVVFRPLLLYNTAMGVAYVAAGLTAWRSVVRGSRAAAAIFALNAAVLAAIWHLHATRGSVAGESLRAMVLRTVVWLALSAGFAWGKGGPGRPRGPRANG